MTRLSSIGLIFYVSEDFEVDKSNDIYKEMDRIKQRIIELEKENGTNWYREGDLLRGSTLTAEEQQELKQLYARLKELKEEDNRTQ